MPEAYPELSLAHLRRMTDDTGMIQHATYALPNRVTGYTTDDNARALLMAIQAYQKTDRPELINLAHTYMGFLQFMQEPSGQLHNFASYQKHYLDAEASEDAYGRTLWACGYTIYALGEDHPLAYNARQIMERSLPRVRQFLSLRGRAFSLLGLCYRQLGDAPREPEVLIGELADSMIDALARTRGPGWNWFEDMLSYSNAILPMSLWLAYQATEEQKYFNAARKTLDFLTEIQWNGDYFTLVGNDGWYPRGGSMARFDQQPVDAGCLVQAYATAYATTGEPAYIELAAAAFEWFLGRNILGVPLYDLTTGGCYDGLQPDGVNINQGAESLLAYLLGRLAVASYQVAKVAI